MSRLLRLLPILLALLVAACGTVATPVWSEEAQGTQAALLVTSDYETSIAPTATNTPEPTVTNTTAPTNTPQPASATPTTEAPTATSVPPTEAPTEEVVSAAGAPSGDAANGQVLFETFRNEVSFACNTCHHVASEDRLIGPGLLNISTRAETRARADAAHWARWALSRSANSATSLPERRGGQAPDECPRRGACPEHDGLRASRDLARLRRPTSLNPTMTLLSAIQGPADRKRAGFHGEIDDERVGLTEHLACARDQHGIHDLIGGQRIHRGARRGGRRPAAERP